MKLCLLPPLLALTFAGAATAQQIETPPPPKDEPKAVGYLPKDALNFTDVLKGPPSLGSVDEAADFATVAEMQRTVSPERWASAEQDDKVLLVRFSDTYGAPLNRATLPRTVKLLNRALRDAYNLSSAGKSEFKRARPFQRVQVARLCGHEPALPPEPIPKTLTSYPSGHTTYGWTTALVLSDVVPEKRFALYLRARDYGESRYICGWHFPTDVAAGKAVATAVVARLEQDPSFKHDVACAAAEYRNVTRGEAMPKGC